MAKLLIFSLLFSFSLIANEKTATRTEKRAPGQQPPLGATADRDLAPEESKTQTTKTGYVQIVENKLKVWNQVIDTVRAGKYQDEELVRNLSPEEAKTFADDLERQSKVVSKDLQELKKAPGEEWKHWQSRIQDKLAAMRKQFGNKLAE